MLTPSSILFIFVSFFIIYSDLFLFDLFLVFVLNNSPNRLIRDN